jgi:hypothetical protein
VDLERLFRATRETITRDRIEIDFKKLLGRPIACLEMKPRPKEYETYMVILPGELIYQFYEEFGARLFEFNVRSFLQAKGGWLGDRITKFTDAALVPRVMHNRFL